MSPQSRYVLFAVTLSLTACASSVNRSDSRYKENCGGFAKEKSEALSLQETNSAQLSKGIIDQATYEFRQPVLEQYYQRLVTVCTRNKNGEISDKAYIEQTRAIDKQYLKVQAEMK
jgi:hypothetical protein